MPNLRHKLSNKSRPTKVPLHGKTNDSVTTKSRTNTKASSEGKHQQRAAPKKRAASTETIDGKLFQSATTGLKSIAHGSLSPTSRIGTFISSRSTSSDSALVDIPRFSSNSLLKYPCKWEAVEIRYMERDRCSRLNSTSESDNVSINSQSKPFGVILDAKEAASTAAGRKQQCLQSEQSEVQKQTVVVEKLHVRNLLNTIREQCGDLSTSRLSEYRPAQLDALSPKFVLASAPNPNLPCSSSADNASESMLGHSLIEYGAREDRQGRWLDVSYDDDESTISQKCLYNVEKEKGNYKHKYCDKYSRERHCSRIFDESSVYSDISLLGKSTVSCSSPISCGTRDQATQLDSDVADTIVICPKRQPGLHDQILRHPISPETCRRLPQTEISNRVTPRRPLSRFRENEDLERQPSKSPNDPPILSQQEIECYKKIALRILLDRKKLEQNRFRKRSEPLVQRHKAANGAAYDRNRLTSTVRASRPRKAQKPLSLSNSSVLKFAKSVEHVNSAESAPVDHHAAGTGTILSAARIMSQIEKHKRRMSQSPKAQASRSSQHPLKKPRRKFLPSSRGKYSQANKTNKLISENTQQFLGATRNINYRTNTRSSSCENDWRSNSALPPAQVSTQTMSPLSRTLLSSVIKQEQIKSAAKNRPKKNEKNGFNTQKHKNAKNVLIYDEFHQMMLQAAKHLAHLKSPTKVKITENQRSMNSSTVAVGNHSYTSPGASFVSKAFKTSKQTPGISKSNEVSAKTKRWTQPPRVTNTFNSTKKLAPSQTLSADVKEQQPCPVSFSLPEKKDQYDYEKGFKYQKQRQQLEQQQYMERHPKEQQHNQYINTNTASLSNKDIKIPSSTSFCYKGESPLNDKTSTPRKLPREVINLGFTEMLRNILKSPTARATQALGSFQADQAINGEETRISQMTVEQIIRCYQDLFSSTYSHTSFEKSHSSHPPENLHMRADSERAPPLRTLSSTDQPPASPKKASALHKAPHPFFAANDHRPYNVDEKRHQMRSASLTLDVQKTLSGFRRQTQSSLNKINVPFSSWNKPPSPIPFVKSNLRNHSLERQSDGGKVQFISKEINSLNESKFKHDFNSSPFRRDSSKSDLDSPDISTILCSSHPVMSKHFAINGKQCNPVVGNSLNKIKEPNANPCPGVILDEEDGSKDGPETRKTRFNIFKEDQTFSKAFHNSKSLIQQDTGVTQMEYTNSDFSISSPGYPSEGEIIKFHNPQDRLIGNELDSTFKNELSSFKRKVFLSSSQPSIGCNACISTPLDLSKFQLSKSTRAFSESALQSASAYTEKPPVPISRKLPGSGFPKHKNSFENLLKQKLKMAPFQRKLTSNRSECQSLAKYDVSESLTSSVLKQKRLGNKKVVKNLENSKETEKIAQSDDSRKFQTIEIDQPHKLHTSFYAEISNESSSPETYLTALKEKQTLIKLRRDEASPSLSDSGLWSRHKQLHEAWQSLSKEFQGKCVTPYVQLRKDLEQKSCAFGDRLLPGPPSLPLEMKDLKRHSTQALQLKEANGMQTVTREVLQNKYLNVDEEDQTQVSKIRSCGAVTQLASCSEGTYCNEDCTSQTVREKPPVTVSTKTTLPYSLPKPSLKHVKKKETSQENESAEDSSLDATDTWRTKFKPERHFSRNSDAFQSPNHKSPSTCDENVVKLLQDRTVAKTCEMVLNQPQFSDTVTNETTESREHKFSLVDFSDGSNQNSKQDDVFMTRASPSSSQHSSWMLSGSWEDERKRKEKYTKIKPLNKRATTEPKQCVKACQQHVAETFKAQAIDEKQARQSDESGEKLNSPPTQHISVLEGKEKASIYSNQTTRQSAFLAADVPQKQINCAFLLHEKAQSQSSHSCGLSNCSDASRAPTEKKTAHAMWDTLKETETGDSSEDSSTRGLASGDTVNNKTSDSLTRDPHPVGLSHPEISTENDFISSHTAHLKARPLTSLQELKLSRIGRSIFAESRQICLDVPKTDDCAVSTGGSPAHVLEDSQETCFTRTERSDSPSTHHLSYICHPACRAKTRVNSATFTMPSEIHSGDSINPDSQAFNSFSQTPHDHQLRKINGQVQCGSTITRNQRLASDIKDLSEIYNLHPDSSSKDFTRSRSLSNMNVAGLSISAPRKKVHEFSWKSALKEIPYSVNSGTQTPCVCGDKKKQTPTLSELVLGIYYDIKSLKKLSAQMNHPPQLMTKENTDAVSTAISRYKLNLSRSDLCLIDTQKQSCHTHTQTQNFPDVEYQSQQKKFAKSSVHRRNGSVKTQTLTQDLKTVMNDTQVFSTTPTITSISSPRFKSELLAHTNTVNRSHTLPPSTRTPKSPVFGISKANEVSSKSFDKDGSTFREWNVVGNNAPPTAKDARESFKGASVAGKPTYSMGPVRSSSPKRSLSRKKSDAADYIERRVWENLELFIESVKQDFGYVRETSTSQSEKRSETCALSLPPRASSLRNTTGDSWPTVATEWSPQFFPHKSYSGLQENKKLKLTFPAFMQVIGPAAKGGLSISSLQRENYSHYQFSSNKSDHPKAQHERKDKPNKEGINSRLHISSCPSMDFKQKNETKHVNIFTSQSPPKSEVSFICSDCRPSDLADWTIKTCQSPCLRQELSLKNKTNICVSFQTPFVPHLQGSAADCYIGPQCLVNRLLEQKSSTDISTIPLLPGKANKIHSSCPPRWSKFNFISNHRKTNPFLIDTTREFFQPSSLHAPPQWVDSKLEPACGLKQSVVLTEEDIHFLTKVSDGKEPQRKDSAGEVLSLDVSKFSKFPSPNENENLMLFSEETTNCQESHGDDDSISRYINEGYESDVLALADPVSTQRVQTNSSLAESRVPIISSTSMKCSKKSGRPNITFDKKRSVPISSPNKKDERTDDHRYNDASRSDSDTLSQEYSNCISYSRYMNSDEFIFCSKFCSSVGKESHFFQQSLEPEHVSRYSGLKSEAKRTPTTNEKSKPLVHSKAVKRLKRSLFENLLDSTFACPKKKTKVVYGKSGKTNFWHTINLVTSKLFELIENTKYLGNRRSKPRRRQVIFNRKGCVRLQKNVTFKHVKSSTTNKLPARRGNCHGNNHREKLRIPTYIQVGNLSLYPAVQTTGIKQTKKDFKSSHAQCSELSRDDREQKHNSLNRKACRDSSTHIDTKFEEMIASGNVPVKTFELVPDGPVKTLLLLMTGDLGEKENVIRNHDAQMQMSAEKTKSSEMEHMQSTISFRKDPGENSSLNANQIRESDLDRDSRLWESPKVTLTDSSGSLESVHTRGTKEKPVKPQSPVTSCFSSHLSLFENISSASDHFDIYSESSLSFTDHSCTSSLLRNTSATYVKVLDTSRLSKKIELPCAGKQIFNNIEKAEEQRSSVLFFPLCAETNCPVQETSTEKQKCSDLYKFPNTSVVSLPKLQFPLGEARYLSRNLSRLLPFAYELMCTGLRGDTQLHLTPKSNSCAFNSEPDPSDIGFEKKTLPPGKQAQSKFKKFAEFEKCSPRFDALEPKNMHSEKEVEEIPQVKTRGYRELETLQGERGDMSLAKNYMNNETIGQLFSEQEEDRQILGTSVKIFFLPPADEGRVFIDNVLSRESNESPPLSFDAGKGKGFFDERKPVSFLECTNLSDEIDGKENVEERYTFLPYTTEYRGPREYSTFCYPKNVVILDEKYASETGQFIHPDGNIIFCCGKEPDKSISKHTTESVERRENNSFFTKSGKQCKKLSPDQRRLSKIIDRKKTRFPSCPQQNLSSYPHKRHQEYCVNPCSSNISTPLDRKFKSSTEETVIPDSLYWSINRLKAKQPDPREQTSGLKYNQIEPGGKIHASSSYESCTNIHKFKKIWHRKPVKEQSLSTPYMVSEFKHGWWHIPTSPATKPRYHKAPKDSIDNFDVDTYDDLGSFVTEMQDTTTSSSRTWDHGLDSDSPWEGGCVKNCSMTFTRTSSADLMGQLNLAQRLRPIPSTSSSLLNPTGQMNVYVDNSTQVHSTLHGNSAPLRCQGEQTDFFEQTSDKSIQADPSRTPSVNKKFDRMTHENHISAHLTAADKTTCDAPYPVVTVQHPDTFVCSVLQDFMRLSLATFVEKLVENKLKKQTNSIACQNNESHSDRYSGSERDDTSSESSVQVSKSSLGVITERTEATPTALHALNTARNESLPSSARIGQNSSAWRGKRDATSAPLRPERNLIKPPSTPSSTNSALKRDRDGSPFTGFGGNSVDFFKENQPACEVDSKTKSSDSREVEKLIKPEFTSFTHSKQTTSFKQAKSMNSSFPLRLCQSCELQSHVTRADQSRLCNHKTKGKNLSPFSKLVHHPTPQEADPLQLFTLDQFDQLLALENKPCVFPRQVWSSVDNRDDSLVCVKGRHRTFSPMPLDLDKSESIKPAIILNSSNLSNLDEKTQKTSYVSSPNKILCSVSKQRESCSVSKQRESCSVSKQRESCSMKKDSACETTTISSSSSSLVDYGGLKYVLSRESKDLWKQLTILEKSYESCELCKKQYKKTTGRSLSPQWIRPVTTYKSRPCCLHKSSSFQRSQSVQLSESSTKTEREFTQTMIRSITKPPKLKHLANENFKNGDNTCEKLSEMLDEASVPSLSETRTISTGKHDATCPAVRNQTNKGIPLPMQSSASHQPQERMLTNLKSAPQKPRPDLKRRLKLSLTEEDIPPSKKASKSSCSSMNYKEKGERPYSRGKVTGGAYRSSGIIRYGQTARMVQLFERSSSSSDRNLSCGLNSAKPSTIRSGSSGRSNNASCIDMTNLQTKPDPSSRMPLGSNVKYDSICEMAVFHTAPRKPPCRTKLGQSLACPHENLSISWTKKRGECQEGFSRPDTLLENNHTSVRHMVTEFSLRPLSWDENEKNKIIMKSTSPTPRTKRREYSKQKDTKIEDHEPQFHSTSPDADECIKTLGNILCEMRNTFPDGRKIPQIIPPEKSDLSDVGSGKGNSEMLEQKDFVFSPKHSKTCKEKNSASFRPVRGGVDFNLSALYTTQTSERSRLPDQEKKFLAKDSPVPREVESEAKLSGPQIFCHDSQCIKISPILKMEVTNQGSLQERNLTKNSTRAKHPENNLTSDPSRTENLEGYLTSGQNHPNQLENILDYARVEQSEKGMDYGQSRLKNLEIKIGKKLSSKIEQGSTDNNNVSRALDQGRKKEQLKGSSESIQKFPTNKFEIGKKISYDDEKLRKDGTLVDIRLQGQSQALNRYRDHSVETPIHRPSLVSSNSCDITGTHSCDDITADTKGKSVTWSKFGTCGNHEYSLQMTDSIRNMETFENVHRAKENAVQCEKPVKLDSYKRGTNSISHWSVLKTVGCKKALDMPNENPASKRRQQKMVSNNFSSFEIRHVEEPQRSPKIYNGQNRSETCNIVALPERALQKHMNLSKVPESFPNAFHTQCSFVSAMQQSRLCNSKTYGPFSSDVIDQNNREPQVTGDPYETTTSRRDNGNGYGKKDNISMKALHEFRQKQFAKGSGSKAIEKKTTDVKAAAYVNENINTVPRQPIFNSYKTQKRKDEKEENSAAEIGTWVTHEGTRRQEISQFQGSVDVRRASDLISPDSNQQDKACNSVTAYDVKTPPASLLGAVYQLSATDGLPGKNKGISWSKINRSLASMLRSSKTCSAAGTGRASMDQDSKETKDLSSAATPTLHKCPNAERKLPLVAQEFDAESLLHESQETTKHSTPRGNPSLNRPRPQSASAQSDSDKTKRKFVLKNILPFGKRNSSREKRNLKEKKV